MFRIIGRKSLTNVIRRSLAQIFDASGQALLVMPKFQSAERGTVNRWLIKEGEKFSANETICEVTVGGVTIGMNVDEPGVVAHIKAKDDAVLPIGEVIGIVTDSQESYLTYFEALRLEMYEEQKVKEFNEDYELKHQKPSATVLMKVIKGLIRDGKIESGSDFASTLLTLARKGDPQLLNSFEASCEGLHYEEQSFDREFFLENAEEIVKEYNKKKE